MSDRQAIVQTLRQIETRVRANRLVERLAFGSLILIVIALFVKVWDLLFPLSSSTIQIFWVLWFIALAAFIGRTLVGGKGTLSGAAAHVDQKAQLKNEITSAYWFMENGGRNPWIELQVHRAAETARRLDPKRLYPRTVGATSYLTVGLGVLLLILNFAPLPIDHNWLYSREAPTLTLSGEDEALLEEIEELIEQAQELEQDEVVEQLEELIEALRSGELSAGEALEELDQIQDLLDEGNLSMASIIEGLDEIGQDLQQSEDTREAGEAMSGGDLEQAAEDMRRLAEHLGAGEQPDEDLQEALEQASENTRPGLEELAEKLQAASENLQNQDQEALEQALEEASRELENLSEMVESQQIKNQASQQLEDLQNSLREQQNQEQQAALEEALEQMRQQQDQQAQAQQQGETGQQQQDQMSQEQAAQQGRPDAEPEFAPGAAGEGQMADQASAAGQPEEVQGFDATGTGQMPSGFGFSPEEKEGAPTSLDVQLREERMEAQQGEDFESEAEKIEEESLEQRSKLDYRNVRSDLTPAQQDLLNQDQIPREYRNLIREYFQAIRTRPTP